MANPTGKGGPKKGEKRNPSGMTRDIAASRKAARELVHKSSPELLERAIELALTDAKEGKAILQYLVSTIIGKDAEQVELTTKTGNPASGMTTEQTLELLHALTAKTRGADGGTARKPLAQGRAVASVGQEPVSATPDALGQS